MAPRVSKDTFRSSDSLIMKLTRAKKSYNVPGYVRGDYDQIRAVFFLHSVDEKMTYEAFLDSKYLRFWPGSFNYRIDDFILKLLDQWSNICLTFINNTVGRVSQKIN